MDSDLFFFVRSSEIAGSSGAKKCGSVAAPARGLKVVLKSHLDDADTIFGGGVTKGAGVADRGVLQSLGCCRGIATGAFANNQIQIIEAGTVEGVERVVQEVESRNPELHGAGATQTEVLEQRKV
ncbi:hypothetical protein ACP_0869 [Acidobacterium capsulatum ATCC 51196]|uniref:Uncharacterized protein n=1 Tax=Acidobacterium capsulatum (strain ATCC 51196 / DSM 11244 / BCRC 80197 / JCM 7670 / NBRC 15755 / NCIMB 13165 / 161) TaxID=240015 RepID=C1F2W9_ACIC5|nr:hypothetical protein ACP_0869 [Acidobacterium capsulatum ATCC 51196]